MQVQLIDKMGTDLSIINAMLVSTDKNSLEARELTSADQGRLNFLMREHHASPYEAAVLTFYVECSLAVRSEWQRHRTQAYSEFSFRYSVPKELEFHLPAVEDFRKQVGKPGAYSFESMDREDAEQFREEFELLYATVASVYDDWIERGLAREMARGILPVNTMTKFYATANLRNWFNFLVLRNAAPAMKEIRGLAEEVEAIIAEQFPGCYAAWLDNGRPQL